jgi:hypothetical protein
MRGIERGALSAVLAGCGLLLAAGSANAAATLGFSYAATGVGHCTGGVCAGHIIYSDQDSQFGYLLNATAASSDPTWGVAHAAADPGAGPLALPELHSDVSAAVSHTSAGLPWDYSFSQGANRYEWMGPSADIAVSDFVGFLSFTNTGGSFSTSGFGEASASLAILTGAVGRNPLGDTWFADDGTGGFQADCSTAGAIGVGETGAITTIGSVSRTVTASCPGVTTFHLNPGDDFTIWARLFTFRENGGTTDASHTFAVGFAPGLSADTESFLVSNMRLDLPEPSAWALMVLGLGGAGAALRARRKPGAASA